MFRAAYVSKADRPFVSHRSAGWFTGWRPPRRDSSSVAVSRGTDFPARFQLEPGIRAELRYGPPARSSSRVPFLVPALLCSLKSSKARRHAVTDQGKEEEKESVARQPNTFFGFWKAH